VVAISQQGNTSGKYTCTDLKEAGRTTGKGAQKKVKYEEAFHFKTDEDGYTGIVAMSLYEFASKLETIPIDSVLFHYYRGDFQKWIRDVFGYNELAYQIDLIAANRWIQELANRIDLLEPSLSGEKLRKRLVELIGERLATSTEGHSNDLSSAKSSLHAYTNS
jgi:hypothetical protein